MFALFHYNSDGNHTSRYSLYRRRYTDSCVVIEKVATSDLILEENNVKPVPTIIKIQKRSGVGTRLTVWWETTWKVTVNNQDVPVLDFLNKEFFCIKPTITAINDTKRWCELRRQEQLSLFEQMKEVIASQVPRNFPGWILYQTDDKLTPSEIKEQENEQKKEIQYSQMITVGIQTDLVHPVQPILPTNITFRGARCIPGFIAEALVIKAILKEDSCPISMNLYKECTKVSVTNCYHCFDEESLNQWLHNKNECPVCKTLLHSFVSMEINCN